MYKEDDTTMILVKLNHPDAKVPLQSEGNAGRDLYSIIDALIKPGQRVLIDTGISTAFPEGYVGLIWPRSGLSAKNGIDVLAGVIDENYRGNISVCLLNTGEEDVFLPKGSRIAQMIIQQYNNEAFMVVDELSETTRSDKGFGWSGIL
jgi:dUTP pyrophosphatase